MMLGYTIVHTKQECGCCGDVEICVRIYGQINSEKYKVIIGQECIEDMVSDIKETKKRIG